MMESLPKELQFRILKYIEFPKTNIQQIFENVKITRSCNYINSKLRVFKGINKYKAVSWTLHSNVDNEPLYYYRSQIRILSPNHTRYPNCLQTRNKLIININNT